MIVRITLVLVASTLVLADVPKDTTARVEKILSALTLEQKLGHLTQVWGGGGDDSNPGVRAQRLDDLRGQISAGLVGTFLGAHGAEYTNTLQKIAVESAPQGIPLLLANDVIHGYRTIFPIPLGEAATWDPELLERAAHVAATEARAAGTHWTFAPMIDVCRDARWGRIAETAGEDPFLGAAMAVARVRGFQGADLKAPDRVLACGKHYVAYGAPEGGRDYNTVDISLQTLHETHLPTFHAAVKAGVGSIMSAFNEINGVPASGHPYTLDTVLRQDWGFDGVVVSDWSSVTEMIAHGWATDAGDAAWKAIQVGVDIDMSSQSYRGHLAEYVKRGLLKEDVINTSVRRSLMAREKLGLFENPYSDPELEKKVTLSAEHRAIAREVAQKAIVLLKNDGGLLPLPKTGKKIAVIGPLADSDRDPLGTWAAIGKPEDTVTVLDGLRAALGDGAQLEVVRGSDVLGPIDGGVDAAVKAAQTCDVAVLVVGETEKMSGEALCRATIDLPPPQLELVKAVHATGKPVVVVLLHGRPLALPWIAENIPAVLATWHLGTECGNAVADVLFGDVSPGGKLPATFPRVTGQIPLYYNHKNTGRPPVGDERFTSKYIDVAWTPQWPFGFGLSYTTFAYADWRVSSDQITADGTLAVSVTVKNTGARAGDEVVQLYFRDPVARMTRPVRQLCGFKRISLAPGAAQTVEFEVPATTFGFYDWDMNFVVEPGEIEFYGGGDSTAPKIGGTRIVAAE